MQDEGEEEEEKNDDDDDRRNVLLVGCLCWRDKKIDVWKDHFLKRSMYTDEINWP